MKINIAYIKTIILFCSLIFFTPFVFDTITDKQIRFIISSSAILIVLINYAKKIKNLIVLFYWVTLIILFFIIWHLQGNYIPTNGILVVWSLFVFLNLNEMLLSNNIKNEFNNIITLVIKIAILSTIISFIFFNLLQGIGFYYVDIGRYSEFNTSFNPLLGVISERTILQLRIGRPCWFFNEPSYLGFFHGLNFFYFKNKNDHKFQFLSLIALLLTFSLGSWISLGLVFIIYYLFKITLAILKYAYLKELKFKVSNILLNFIFILLFFILIKYQNEVISFIQELEKFSSSEDRNIRIENSFRILNNSNFYNLLFGNGPGSIENIFNKGESNGWLKSFIEEGILVTCFYFYYLLKHNISNKKSILLLIFLLFSFNSVVLMYSPFIAAYIAKISSNE